MLCDTGNNQITGTIPEMLGNIRKLETLRLGAFFLFWIVLFLMPKENANTYFPF